MQSRAEISGILIRGVVISSTDALPVKRITTPRSRLTLGHVETREEELSISNTALSVSGVAHHAGNEVAEELEMRHKLLCRNAGRECSQRLVVGLQYGSAVVVQAMRQFAYDHRDLLIEVGRLLPCCTRSGEKEQSREGESMRR